MIKQGFLQRQGCPLLPSFLLVLLLIQTLDFFNPAPIGARFSFLLEHVFLFLGTMDLISGDFSIIRVYGVLLFFCRNEYY